MLMLLIEMREFRRPLMNLIVSKRKRQEAKGLNYEVTNCIRPWMTTNDDASFMAVRAKERKWAMFDGSNAKVGKLKEYFIPLYKVIARPGVQKALFDRLKARPISEYNFHLERVETESYSNSRLQSIPKEPLDHALTIQTSELFAHFITWATTPENGGIGEASDYSTTPPRFSVFLNKVPGFSRSLHHGAMSTFKLTGTPLAQHLLDCNLLSPFESEWLLSKVNRTDDKDLTRKEYIKQRLQQMKAEAEAEIENETIKSTHHSDVADSYLATKSLNYTEDVARIDISAEQQYTCRAVGCAETFTTSIQLRAHENDKHKTRDTNTVAPDPIKYAADAHV
eukprot:15422-Heterococcus_DN1.PRE.3